jgi:Rrf2 family nitric oxide-sensitive transcriptional repressor
MQLTLYTDYSLRVLVYLGLKTDELATISEIAKTYAISRNHLVKVVHNLSSHGYVDAVRGKGGGLRLARAAEQINIGDVVRHTETNFDLVECFNKDEPGECPIISVCKLKSGLRQAFRAFMAVLDEITLADVLSNRDELARPLNIVLPFPALKSKARRQSRK